jgi:protein TonB
MAKRMPVEPDNRVFQDPDKPGRVLLALTLLVLLLHVLVYRSFRQPPRPPAAHAMPFKLEVSLLPSAETPTANNAESPASHSAASQPPNPKVQEQPKETAEKKPPQPPKPHKSEELADVEAIIKSQQPKTVARSVKSQPESRSVQAVSSYMFHSRPKSPNAKDNFPESDEHNPSPEYPDMAIFLGYQGAAIIRINVTPKGLSSGVQVVRSSGHKILDESALKTLKKWRFTATNQADSVIIVVDYILR